MLDAHCYLHAGNFEDMVESFAGINSRPADL